MEIPGGARILTWDRERALRTKTKVPRFARDDNQKYRLREANKGCE